MISFTRNHHSFFVLYKTGELSSTQSVKVLYTNLVKGDEIMNWFDQNYNYVDEFTQSWNEKYKRMKTCMIIYSIILIGLGLCCFFFPQQVFTTIQVICAIGIMIGGVLELTNYFQISYFFRDPLLIVSGIFKILLGLLLITTPIKVTVTMFTFMFAFILLTNGIQKISFGSRMRFFQIFDSGYFRLIGWIHIILAMIFMFIPFESALFLNYVLAIYFVVYGISMLIEALSMKTI